MVKEQRKTLSAEESNKTWRRDSKREIKGRKDKVLHANIFSSGF
jgi:hypothetical protein